MHILEDCTLGEFLMSVIYLDKRQLCALDVTLWKFHDFSVTQILREINFREFRICKTAVSVILEALDFVNLVHFSLQKVPKFIKSQIQSLSMSENGIF